MKDFAQRHIGPNLSEIEAMLKTLGVGSVDELIEETVPAAILKKAPLDLPEALSESEALNELRSVLSQNRPLRSFLGMGYAETVLPPVIQRNILENPGWYTAYTPYQAEIAQGRLEALLNFQTLVADLTGLPIANASLLDEATAAAEAMQLALAGASEQMGRTLFVDSDCHPQVIAVVATRAEALGVKILVAPTSELASVLSKDPCFAALFSYPGTSGAILPLKDLIARTHSTGALALVSCDLFALLLLESPGSLGADVVVGTAQRFGVPMGFGGPHAAFMSTKEEHVRRLPGRLVGVSKDRRGTNAVRLALQTREQHIRRDKATSNICTAQVLLAVINSAYAVYHGPERLRAIASDVHDKARRLGDALVEAGFKLRNAVFFDTLAIETGAKTATFAMKALQNGFLLRTLDEKTLAMTIDEATTLEDLAAIATVFGIHRLPALTGSSPLPVRKDPYLSHPVFHRYHSETELLRYLKHLENRDLSLTRSMIPLGSCTMKLNATAEMLPVTWPSVSNVHPFTPSEYSSGYREMFSQLEKWLAEITGFDSVSLQPNSGAQGEYAGLLVIRRYFRERGESERNVCLIPSSAHGTNPASAAMADFKIVVVRCDSRGNIDMEDLKKRAQENRERLAALMITYPSTHGVFESQVVEACRIVHEHGGQVYMDGANLNAQVGLCRPGEFGPDVCHLNLHKTFCIPHGGGGPGMGPIAVASHLAPYLPSHPVIATGGKNPIGPVSAAPWGSASILPIPWMYIRMMGAAGLKHATEIAILNANYVANRLEKYFPVLYRGEHGRVAHECILDVREAKKTAGVEVEDIAKRLMDYGFHAPTVSFPVPGTLMVEPTESESKEELDRFCEAMISIHAEIESIRRGEWSREDNPLKNAPHVIADIVAAEWTHPYSRETAALPKAWLKDAKYWPPVARIDSVAGDRNLFCTCPPLN